MSNQESKNNVDKDFEFQAKREIAEERAFARSERERKYKLSDEYQYCVRATGEI